MNTKINRAPTHPGAILREDVLVNLGINVSALARALFVSRQTLHSILKEAKPVTPNIALRLGKFLGNGPDIWLRLQESHDLWRIEKKIAGDLAKIEKYHAA